MLDAGVPAAFEDVQKAGEIGVGIGVRIFDRIAHARLGSEMHDLVEAAAGEQVAHGVAVADIGLQETKTGTRFEAREPGELQLRIVIIADIVEADDLFAPLQQPLRDM